MNGRLIWTVTVDVAEATVAALTEIAFMTTLPAVEPARTRPAVARDGNLGRRTHLHGRFQDHGNTRDLIPTVLGLEVSRHRNGNRTRYATRIRRKRRLERRSVVIGHVSTDSRRRRHRRR